MDFKYYYIIQDIIGVLMVFIGIRMFILCMKLNLSNKRSKKIILLSIKYALIICAGANFLLSSFGLNPWIISIILIVLSNIITSKYKKVNINA